MPDSFARNFIKKKAGIRYTCEKDDTRGKMKKNKKRSYSLVKETTELMAKCGYANVNDTAPHSRHCAPSPGVWSVAYVDISVE
jgi:hypothetical protein